MEKNFTQCSHMTSNCCGGKSAAVLTREANVCHVNLNLKCIGNFAKVPPSWVNCPFKKSPIMHPD